MAGSTVKEDARKLVDELPEDATWEELEHKIYERRKIERGARALSRATR